MEKKPVRVNCLQCKHYAVSWDTKEPNACKLFGFKSKTMPALVVYESAGKICEFFVKKDGPKANGSGHKQTPMDTSVILSLGDKEERR